jgi:hypothetical protein
MGEWALIHYVSGIMSMGPAVSGDIATFSKAFATLGKSKQIEPFFALQEQGSAAVDDGKGYPYLLTRVHIQHSVNLLFVGVQATVATVCIAMQSRSVLIACLPVFCVDITLLPRTSLRSWVRSKHTSSRLPSSLRHWT